MKGVEHLYDQLGRRERLNLVVEALHRRDMREVGALVDTVPYETYKGQDTEFFRQFQRLHTMTLLRDAMIKDQLFRIAGGLLVYFAMSSETDEMKTEPTQMFVKAAQGLRVMIEGWRRVFETIGFEQSVLLEAFGRAEDPMLIEIVTAAIPEVEPSEADVQAYYECILGFWDWESGLVT